MGFFYLLVDGSETVIHVTICKNEIKIFNKGNFKRRIGMIFNQTNTPQVSYCIPWVSERYTQQLNLCGRIHNNLNLLLRFDSMN